MARKFFDKPLLRSRPLLSVPQVILLLVIAIGIFIAIDFNRRAQTGRLIGTSEESLVSQISKEATRQIELQATLEYVTSDDYIADYARNEGNMLLPGEQRVVTLLLEATPEAPVMPTATPDPATYARPWQAWWRLMTNAPLPTR